MKRSMFFLMLISALTTGIFILEVQSDVRIAWMPPDTYTDGTPIWWEDVAEIVYVPAIANSQYGPWTDLAPTEMTWVILPDPPQGKTRYYNCRVVLRDKWSGFYYPPVCIVGPMKKGGKK